MPAHLNADRYSFVPRRSRPHFHPVKPLLFLSLLACFLLPACNRSGQRRIELQNRGSDTMLEVAGAWAEAYRDVRPDIVVSVSGGGSGTGISAVLNGTTDLANSSRAMKDSELRDAAKLSRKPVQHHVGFDGIAIYVHPDNPITSITLEQLKDLFGDGGKLTRWSQLGIDLGDPKLDPIVLASRQNNSGTYEYFRDAVLGGETGRVKPECMLLNGSIDVVEFCTKTKSAIGYSGMAAASNRVKVVPVIGKAGKPVLPNFDTVLAGEYAISRPLFMITDGEPKPEVKNYLDWILSDAGQRVLMQVGYPPLRKLD
jgi:phosphate transport system substrate-binding protein